MLALCQKHGSAVIALTIDEQGQAYTADRKVAIAERIFALAREYGLRPQDIIFDALTFTLATGDEQYRKVGIETLEGIRRIKERCAGCFTILGLSNCSFGLNPAARQVLNSVFLDEAVKVGLDQAIVHAAKILPLFRIGEDKEEYITEFGGYGEEPGQFIWPMAIGLDKDTNVYVTDEWTNRITIFNKDGEYKSHWGTHGSGDGELDRPAGITIGPDGTVYVVDSRNNRVQKFSLDGKFLGKFGTAGSDDGEFNLPWGICLDKDGNIFVADWRNDRVQSFTNDGKWLATFGRPGTGGDCSIARDQGGIAYVDVPVGQFNRPTGVCVDDDGVSLRLQVSARQS